MATKDTRHTVYFVFSRGAPDRRVIQYDDPDDPNFDPGDIGELAAEGKGLWNLYQYITEAEHLELLPEGTWEIWSAKREKEGQLPDPTTMKVHRKEFRRTAQDNRYADEKV